MSIKMKEMPLSERPYEKLELYGEKSLSNAELLAIIIKTGTREESAVVLAQKILNKIPRDNNIRALSEISIEELTKIKGIGKVKAIQIKAAIELASRMARPVNKLKIKIKSTEDAAKLLMEELRYEKREIAKLLMLDNKNTLLKIIDISLGGTNFAIIEPKNVLSEPIKMNVPKIILAHNHPSGDVAPSKGDFLVTDRIYDAADIMGIELLDHIIIGDGKYQSIMKKWKRRDSKMKLFNFGGKDIGIDLGTANILVTLKGKGIVLKEPSVVAIDRKSGSILATGTEAKEMLGRTPDTIKAVRPLQDGVIADFTATQLLLRNLIQKVCERYNAGRPRVVVGVPSGITEVEERAVEESVLQAGAREVYLIEEPMAAAIGANLDVGEPSGSIIVDIGGGTTEVAVISLGGVVVSNSLRIAGDELDQDIINYIKREKNLAIGETTAEQIKLEIGSAMPLMTEKTMEIRGRDLGNGLPRNIIITSEEVEEAMADSIREIIDVIKMTLEKTPPELSSDIAERGIVLAGGGALIKNIDKLISLKTGMPVYIAEDPLDCVVKGTGKTLEDLERLKHVLINSRRRR